MLKPYVFLLFCCGCLVSCKEDSGNGREKTNVDTARVVKQDTAKQDIIKSEEEKIEDVIIMYTDNIHHQRGQQYGEEPLEVLNKEFLSYLQELCKRPEVLNYEFRRLNDNPILNVLTSEDKKFRIYSWRTELGGTMRYYDAIIQYKTINGSRYHVLHDVSVSMDDGGVQYDTLHSINTKDNKAYYLGQYFAVVSTNYLVCGIRAFAINGDKLDHSVKLFRTGNKAVNDIEYDYYRSEYGQDSKNNFISLSVDKQTLSIPMVGYIHLVTDTSAIYKFNGRQFVFEKYVP